MKKKTNKWGLIGVVILAFFLLSACSGPDEHIWLKSPGWSRAAFLGNTILNDPVPMTLDDDGQIYFALLVDDGAREKKSFNLIALDPSGLPLWEESLDEVGLSRPGSPQITWEEDKLHLYWVDNESLYTLLLDAQGNPLNDAPILLSAEIAVDSYSFAENASGQSTVWFAGARKNPGVYALSTSDGNGEITSIDPNGICIQLRYDSENNLHATWLQYPVGYGTTKLFYGEYPLEVNWGAVVPHIIHELSVSPTSRLDGPLLGIDADDVYVFWTVSIQSGFDAGTIHTSYLHFPLGNPSLASEPKRITMPSIYGLQYEYLSNSPLDAGERVSLRSANLPRTAKIQEIVSNPVQADELAIIFRSPMQHLWRKVRDQVNIAYFYEGEQSSYQPLSFTTTLSTSPNLLNSPDRHLYAVWLEKLETDSYAVYFASTSPIIEEALSRSTGRELGRILAQISFGMLVGVLMAPIAAGVWVVAPLMILFLFAPLRKIGSNRTRGIVGGISLIFAIVAFWLGKMAMLPGMMDYVPFSAWVPEIPHLLANILRWGVPITSSLIALFVAWFYTYRQSSKSTLYFLLIYVGVDSFLTAAVYAVLIYGAI